MKMWQLIWHGSIARDLAIGGSTTLVALESIMKIPRKHTCLMFRECKKVDVKLSQVFPDIFYYFIGMFYNHTRFTRT